jgi:hypothetical protein
VTQCFFNTFFDFLVILKCIFVRRFAVSFVSQRQFTRNYHMIISLVINLSFKTHSPNLIRKEKVGSGYESQLRVPHRLKNIWQVNITTRRLTKLIHDDCSTLIDVRYQCGKGISTLWSSSRMYRRSMITNVSHPYQGVFVSTNIMQRAKVINCERYGNT